MYIHVKVKTNQRQESVEEIGQNRFVVSVKEKPERNLANQAVVVLVSSHLGISVDQVRIISGHTSPTKLLSTSGV